MNIIITKNIIKKISVMEHILSSNGKANNYINAILVKSNGIIQAASAPINMSFRLSVEEMGLTPDLPAEDFIIPEMGYKFLKNLAVGTSVDILPKEGCVEVILDSGKRKKNKAVFATYPASEYPTIDKPNKSTMQQAEINAEWFKSAISKCAYAISSNNSKSLYTAAHLVAKDGKIILFSMDGFKMAVVQDNVDKAEADFQISISTELIKVLNSIDFAETILVSFDTSTMKSYFATDADTNIQSKYLTGELYKYEELLNTGKIAFSLDTKVLVETIKQICSFNSSYEKPMRLTIKNDELVCSYTNEKTTYEAAVGIENAPKFSEEYIMGLNPDNLLSTLKNCVEDKTSFRFEAPLKPLEVYNGDLSAIVVPMRLGKEG